MINYSYVRFYIEMYIKELLIKSLIKNLGMLKLEIFHNFIVNDIVQTKRV